MRAIRIRTDEGVRHGIELSVERKYRRCLFMNSAGLKVERVAIGSEDDRATTEIITASLPAAIRRFKTAAKDFGCTAEVASALGIRRVIRHSEREKVDG